MHTDMGDGKMPLTTETKYDTTVVEIGADAMEFKTIGMLIFFGDQAPELLRSSCYIINLGELQGPVKVNDVLVIDDVTYKITAVGGEVDTNLGNLGHISVVFDGATDAKLAGSLYVEDNGYPEIHEGSVVKILQG